MTVASVPWGPDGRDQVDLENDETQPTGAS
jgi:hypothetical protein